MKITINTDVLNKYNLSFDQFLVLLVSHYNIDCQKTHDELVDMKLAERDLFKGFPPVISDNTKNMIAKILMESDDRAVRSNIDFPALANVLRNYYPKGVKPGTTHEWRGDTEEIAQKLRTLVVKYDFTFTEKEAIDAVKDYVSAFNNSKYMLLLRNFILTTRKDYDGKYEFDSMFMTIIENNRKHEDNN